MFLALALASGLAAWQIVHSRVGAYMRAIRDDEEAAATMGVDTFKWKRFVFAVSAVFAAVAGGFQAHYVGLLSPTPMKFNEMAMIVVMVIVGGLRTFSGPIIGAILLSTTQQLLTVTISSEVNVLVLCVMLVLFVVGAPEGIIGLIRKLFRHRNEGGE